MSATMEEIVDAMRVALGELYEQQITATLGAAVAPDGTPCLTGSWTISNEHANKARRLATTHLDGPTSPVVCDAHNEENRPDVWARCAKVPVRDALMGRLCGQP